VLRVLVVVWCVRGFVVFDVSGVQKLEVNTMLSNIALMHDTQKDAKNTVNSDIINSVFLYIFQLMTHSAYFKV
jgi:hypothetical protein